MEVGGGCADERAADPKPNMGMLKTAAAAISAAATVRAAAVFRVIRIGSSFSRSWGVSARRGSIPESLGPGCAKTAAPVRDVDYAAKTANLSDYAKTNKDVRKGMIEQVDAARKYEEKKK